jgi:hypothetical protein
MKLMIPNDPKVLGEVMLELVKKGLGFECLFEPMLDQWVVKFSGGF